MATIPKVRLSTDVFKQHQDQSSDTAKDRFKVAQAILDRQQTGWPSEPAAVADSVATRGMDLMSATIGSIVRVPIHLIDPNPLSPRHIYTNEEVDRLAQTLPKGQDVAANGYVKNGRLQLIDGGTRLRAAKISGLDFLDVKIEEAPPDMLALYIRARMLNDQRSETTALDFALSIKALLEQGIVKSHRELIDKVPGPKGTKMSETMVSEYMRIAKMPEAVQKRMSENPETSTAIALYCVSELFAKDLDAAELEGRRQIAFDIIAEIKDKHLSRHQIVALVKSKLAGPTQRERSTVLPIDFNGKKAQMRIFAKKGKLELEMSGLNDTEMSQVKTAITRTMSELAMEIAGRTET